jgi:competence protein ComEC
LIFYIALIGLPASAMRAGLMGFLVLLALNIGRLNKMVNSLALAAFILLWINPKLLRDDIGFQLSFLAVLGIFLFNSFFKKIVRYEKIKSSFLKGILEVLVVTMSAQVLTLPIMALNFSQISVIAPLANLLILWTLPFLMILIISALFLSFVFPPLSFYFFLPSFFILRYIIMAATALVKIPGAYLEINDKYFYLVILYYIIIAGVILRIRKK